ncbi:C6 transcription factor [Histoplasma capsulatum G186AR]|uniref:C6 transcription factor n=1 Tax=Ajellomyces capsulatus TaxID=5037 RepID=A0A8H7Z0P6_AJECA|nr:C6 transcription factor [Histoplasma capsulatum]QSS67692.1 C6 transcription factor [Histoplasma capsulatum G186AR]
MSTGKHSESPPPRATTGFPPQCHTCRKRRVRCDSSRPACNKCTAKGVECLGYSKQKPLVWLQGGGNQNQYLAEGNNLEPPKRKKGRPKIIIAKDDAKEPIKSPDLEKDDRSEVLELVETAWDISNSLTNFDHQRVPEAWDFKYPLNIKVVVSTIWYFNKYIYPEIDPIVYYQDLPTIDPKSWQDDVSNLLFSILVSAVATHQAIKSQQDEHITLGREIYQYKQQAFRRLNCELRNPKTQLGDITLICVLTLLLVETQQSAYGEWFAHFEGATTIIGLKGGLKAVLERCPILKSALTCYLIADVLGGTTSRQVLSMDDISRQLGYVGDLSHIFHNGSETFVPFPNELFECVIQINYYRTLSMDAIGTNGMLMDFGNDIQSLLQRILSFSAAGWADSMTKYYSATSVVPHGDAAGEFIQPDRSHWLQIAAIYQSAVLLYCIRSLALNFEGLILASCASDATPDMISYVTVQDIQIVARQTLSDNLGKIFTPESDLRRQSLARVVTWPLFVVGIEAGDDFEDALTLREFVTSSFMRLSRALGTLNYRDARAFLVSEYNRRDNIRHAGNSDYQCWWNDVFEHLPDRCAFFM